MKDLINIDGVEYIRKELKGTDVDVKEKQKDGRPVIERVKTVFDALDIAGKTMEQVIPYAKPVTERETAINTFALLDLIFDVINEGWIADWTNSDQYKYYPYFTQSGSGLSYDDCVYRGTDTSVGSRLCTDTAEKAEYIGRQFIDLYNKLYIKTTKNN